MTSRVRSEAVEMRGKKVKRGGDKSKGAEDGTGGGEMRADRRREVEGRVKAVEGGGGGETQEERAIRGTLG